MFPHAAGNPPQKQSSSRPGIANLRICPYATNRVGRSPLRDATSLRHHSPPYAFTTNGRPYLKQLEEKSGIYFQDLRIDTNKAYAIDGWRTPEGLLAELKQDIPTANADLAATAIDLPGLRPYQIEAISKVEKAVAVDKRELLLAMATGTGKTRTAISLIYRLIKAKRFRRIRSQALGSPLIPFEDRVDKAVTRIRAKSNFQWTENQVRWLDRITKQIKQQALVDQETLNTGAYASQGGFNRVNKSFSGKLDTLLEDLHSEIWSDGAA